MARFLISGLVLCTSWFWLVYCLHENCDTYSDETLQCTKRKDFGETQHSTKRKDFGIEENERRILLIGKTGVGKSTTGNTILGYEAFKAEASFGSVTSQIKVGKAERYGRNLLVVDTPGLYDTGKTPKEVMTEIAKCYGVTTPGLHAIVFVMEIGRFTEEENKTIELYRMFFGENLSKYMILVFTGKDKLERDGKTIQSYVNNIPNSSEFKDFRKLIENIQNRYMAFGLKGNETKREEEVMNFLELIDEVNEMNGDNYYTNKMYMEAEKVMNKRLMEEQRKLNEKHEEEIKELKKQAEKNKELIEQQLKEYEKKVVLLEKNVRIEARCQSESGSGRFFSGILGSLLGGFICGVASFFKFW